MVSLFSVFASLKYILYWVLLSFYRTPEDRTKLALNLHSWKMIYLNIIGLFLSCFWCTTFIFLSLRCIFDGRRIKYRISPFWIGIACVFHPYFLVFSEILSVMAKEWKFCCIPFRFVLWSQNNVPVKSKLQHPPPGNPRVFVFFAKFLFKSPLPRPKSCSNAPS